MTPIRLSLITLIATVAFLSGCQSAYQSTESNKLSSVTIVENGAIYTVNEQQPNVEAFAFSDDRIVAVGDAQVLRGRFPDAKTLDLKGATVVPGIIDAHVHLLSLGYALMRVDLVGSTDKEDILARLKRFAANLPEGEWLLGRGWDQNDWPVKELPTAADLDEAFPDRPIWLTRIDGHAAWANSAAMRYADKDLNGTWQPDGGEIIRDKNGIATGVFVDNAEILIASKVPPISESQSREALQRAMDRTASVGLTSVHNAGTSKSDWEIIKAVHDEGGLRVRYYAMANGANEMLDYLCENGLQMADDPMLTARSVKLYSDGALGSRGAALLEPYSDSPKQRGLLIEKPEVLAAYAKRAADCGLQVNIHAIGDRGNRVTLDALQAAQNPDNPGRHRIEHSQIVAAIDFQRFKSLNLIASVQPTHATSDMYWAEDRVGDQRIKGAYAWQTFVENGVPLALGSDFPVEKADPLLGFHAAVTRQDAKGWPTDGWYPSQKLSRAEALYGFTMGAAYAAFQEDQLGSLEEGKKADFVVFSKNIMTIPEGEILTAKVLKTFLDGKLIYKADK